MTMGFWLLCRGLLLSLLLLLMLSLLLILPLPVWPVAAAPLRVDHYHCAGDPLLAEVFAGAVDAPGMANSSAGTVPGSYVVLHWRDGTLQLPRSNNAGPPSFTDGRWWWRVADPEQPEFRQRRGAIEEYTCRRDQPEPTVAADQAPAALVVPAAAVEPAAAVDALPGSVRRVNR